jgi:hypothetical protein
MKKIFKGLSVLVATAALGAGIVTATACNGGNGTFIGEYHYNSHNTEYGIRVEVTVENNIITKVRDITNTELDKQDGYVQNETTEELEYKSSGVEWTSVSPGWETYVTTHGGALSFTYWAYPDVDFSNMSEEEKVKYVNEHPISWYSWLNADSEKWTNYENWLLQQYVGWSVADIIDIDVFYSSTGEPYATKDGYNAELLSSGLLITNSTQGSGRLLLAVQNALGK